ncbi:MAG: bifunctional 2-polyprenyl-6-hydroxyphenol methylase/3-demethylubiquinol 3-O-methyltransferase UbiG [Thermodesulfobacteriota bacterium]
MAPAIENIDYREIAHFSEQARYWWDPKGPLEALHDINPLRLNFIRQGTAIRGRRVADIGCGGGILTEALARAGGNVTGIDWSESALAAARDHMKKSGLSIDYRHATAEILAEEMPGRFDVVVCMEMLEHVPSPQSILSACAALVKPGGHVFVSTINRTLLSRFLVIFVAERVLGVVEKGTHAYPKFIKPREMVGYAESAGLVEKDGTGYMYLPVLGAAWEWPYKSMNYMMHFIKELDTNDIA